MTDGLMVCALGFVYWFGSLFIGIKLFDCYWKWKLKKKQKKLQSVEVFVTKPEAETSSANESKNSKKKSVYYSAVSEFSNDGLPEISISPADSKA